MAVQHNVFITKDRDAQGMGAKHQGLKWVSIQLINTEAYLKYLNTKILKYLTLKNTYT